MFSILFAADPDRADQLIADLWEAGTSGIIESDGQFRGFLADLRSASQLTEKYNVLEIRREIADPVFQLADDWDPILAGEKFFIAPSWIKDPTPEGRFRLTVDSTDSFGTGRHESTQLMLEAMETYVNPRTTVVDIGAGTGILSVAAIALGAAKVYSCDIDEGAFAAVAAAPVLTFIGSADAIAQSAGDLVLANISARVLDTIAADLRRVVKHTGHLLISGFVEEDPPRRFSPELAWQKGDWLCWLCKPESVLLGDGEKANPAEPHAKQWW